MAKNLRQMLVVAVRAAATKLAEPSIFVRAGDLSAHQPH